MNIEMRLTRGLYEQIQTDLGRPHPFAAERVGFAFGRTGSLPAGGKLILLQRYHSIQDDHYLEDETVGARIGSEAILEATQAVFSGRSQKEGAFHVHLHSHHGQPIMSGTDEAELPKLMPGFQSVGTDAAHGIIILSLDHGSAWIWLPKHKKAFVAERIAIIGAPISIFKRRVSGE